MSWNYEAENEKAREEFRQAAKRGEARIKNLISTVVYIMGALALLSAFFHPDPDRTTHGLLLLILGTLIRRPFRRSVAYKPLALDKDTPPHLRELILKIENTQFSYVRTVLRILPKNDNLTAGCNFAIAQVLMSVN